MNDTTLTPGVSVVVCCYNSAEVIVRTMEALSRQTIPLDCAYEVILVDNACIDDTVRLAQSTWQNCPVPLRIVRESQPGLIYARKTGVLEAHYSILLFVDDDNILAQDWVLRLMEMYAQWPEVGAIGGYNEPLFEKGVEKPGWFDAFAGMYACTPSHENPEVSAFKQTLYGAGLSLRTDLARQIFESPLPLFLVGRTENILSRGEDSEICLRAGLMGLKLWYEKTLKLKHVILNKRVKWAYVLEARRGGGHADIILKIYRELLEGTVPLSYGQLGMHISRLWEVFWHKRALNQDLDKVKNEGDQVALRNHYLQGLTEGFLRMDKNNYEAIKQQIVQFFQKR